jgi:hypothetical protein
MSWSVRGETLLNRQKTERKRERAMCREWLRPRLPLREQPYQRPEKMARSVRGAVLSKAAEKRKARVGKGVYQNSKVRR